MAETVVKTLEIREVGGQRVYDRLSQLTSGAQQTAAAFNEVGQASEATGRRVSSSAREFDRYIERTSGASRATRDYARDLKALMAGLNTGQLGDGARGIANYNAELKKVQQTLQDIGRPTGPTTSFQAMLNDLRGIDVAAKSAKDSAAALSAAFGAMDTGRTSIQHTIDGLHGIGQGALSARDSMDAFGALFEREAQDSARAAAALASEMEQLRQSYDPAYAAAQRMSQELENLARLEREGIAIIGGYEAALDRIALKYDETAQAAARSAVAIQKAREEQDAATFRATANDNQGAFNSLLGVRPDRASARESAAVFEEEARYMETLRAQAARLRAELDPLGAAYDRMNQQIASLQEMRAREVITHDELTEATARSRAAFDDTAKSLKPVNDNVKLTAGQVQNLGYQLNDTATMLALGASPFQIIASQAGQVVQALGDGPGGMRGSLAAIGSSIMGFARSIPTAGYVVAGLTAAVGALWYITKGPAARSAEESVKSFENAVKSLEGAWDGAGKAAERHYERVKRDAAENPAAAALDVQAEARRLQQDYRNAVRDLNTAPGLPEQILRARSGSISEAQQEIRALYGDLVRGEIKASEFSAEMLRIRMDPNADDYARAFAEAIRQGVKPAEDLEARIRGINAAAAELGGKGDRVTSDPNGTNPFDLRDRFGGVTGAAGRFDPEGMDAIRDGLRSQRGELQGVVDAASAAQQALSNFDLSPVQRQIAETTQEYDRRIAAYKLSTEDTIGLASLQAEKEAALALIVKESTRAEETRRAGYELDLRAVGARTAAEKAAIEAERTRIDLIGQGYSASEAAARAEEARTLSLARAREQLSESARQQAESYAQQIAQAQLELDLVGKSAGETARLRAEFEMLTAARQAATAAGFDASEVALTDAMRTQAAEIGRLTEATQRLNFERDVLFERQQATRSPEEQQIAAQLRSIGVEYDSAQGRADAAQLRLNNRLHESNDLLWEMRDATKQAFGDMVSAIGSGENAMDSLISTFAQPGQRLAQAGFDKLFNGLFGTGPAVGSTSGGVIGAIGSIGGGGSQPVYGTAPVTPVQSAPLAALNDNLGRSAKSAMDVARQFEGLNERADSKVLDSFLQASGTWRNLSAKDTAWCASFANAAIIQAGGQGTGSNLASSFMNWGTATNTPKPGDIVVLRPQAAGASGHVGFLAGFKDGKVQLFGGNQSGNAQVSDFGIGEVRSYRTGPGLGTGDMARAVEVGSINATRKVASGSVPGVSVGGSSWGPQFNDVQTVSPNIQQASGGGGNNLLGGTIGGIGLVANAYQGGDAFGGALSGAMGGMELAPLFGVGGPVGAVIGGVVGLISGAIGGRSKRKEAERQAKMQADQAWSQNYNQLLDYKDVVYRVPKGELSGQITELGRTLDEFAKLADATKDSGNKRHIEDIRAQLGRYTELLKDGFRDILDPVLTDLAAGRGLDTAFKKARDGVLAEAESYRGLIEDVKLAFQPDTSGRDAILSDYKGQVADIEKQRRQAQMSARLDEATIVDGNRVDPSADLPAKMAAFGQQLVAAEIERDKAVKAWEEANADVQRRYDEAVAKAVTAAREGLLRVVSGDIVEQSDIEKAIAEAKGAAAGLDVALKDLGMSAEEAATAIEGALAKRMALLTETFTRGLQDQIDELDGKGYLAGFRDLIEQRDTLLKDASLINVDTSLVSTFFAKQAQSIVDGAELAGDGFADLIKLFPELSGVVTEFADAAEDALRAITERIEGYDERRLSALEDTSTYAGAMAAFERRAARERFAEGQAGGQGMLALNAALAAEKVATIQGLLIQARQDEVSEIEDTISRLEGLRDEWRSLRDSLKLDDTLSPLSQYDQFLEAQKQFRETVAAAAGTGPEAEEAQAKLAGISQSYLEEAKAYYASSEDYFAVFNEVQGTLENAESLASQQLKAAQSQLDIAKAQLDAMTGIEDSMATLQAALTAALAASKAATAAATGGGTAGGGDGTSFKPKNELESFLGAQYASILGRAPDAGALDFYAKVRATGATAAEIIAMIKASPEAKARGYAFGGLVSGPGTGMSDSVAAWLSNGEHVTRARSVTPQTLPMLNYVNQTGRLPGNDNGELIAEVRGLRAEVRSLRATVAEGELANVAATRAGVAAQQAAAVEQKKAGSRGR